MGNQLREPVRASAIARWCDVEFLGEDVVINAIAPLSAIEDGALCFAKSPPLDRLTKQCALISTVEAAAIAPCLLVSDRPRLTFAKALDHIQRHIGFRRPDASPKIDPTARVSSLAFIASGVEIGPRSVVMPFAYIGEGTRIGSDCLIKSGAIIGQDGFGFERDEDNLPLRLVHLGRVMIGDHVEIGSLTTVCRGTLADTVVEDHAKIDDHVHIAHNVHVGVGAMVIACAEVSGGVVIGRGAWIGPNASVMQKTIIGNDAFVGIGANVTKSVPEGVTVAGNPARPFPRKS